MDTLPNFYNTLFGIEITTLGIISAATFVCLQILHANYSYKDMLRSLERASVLVYAILSVALIIVTGLGSMFLAFGTYNFIPQFNFETRAIFGSDYTALCLLATFLISAGLGIYVVFESMRLLNPSFLIREHLKRIDSDAVRKFLYNKYGVREPYPRVTILMTIAGKKESKKEKAKKKKEVKDAEDAYEQEKAEFERLTAEITGAPDVFEGFANLVSKAIANADMSTVRGAISDYKDCVLGILKETDAKFPFDLFARHIGDTLAFFLESCRRHDLQSLSPDFVRATREIAFALNESHYSVMAEILKSWKDQADIAIQTSDRSLFREIMQSYRDVTEISFQRLKKNPKQKEDILDECFRHLGWLAERLLTIKGLEAKPMMYDDDYHDEFEALYNALMSFSWKYNYDVPLAYPLIFFDAVHVLFDRLLVIYKLRSIKGSPGRGIDFGDVHRWLYDCIYAYSSFAHDALKAGNPTGVALASMRLCEVYRSAVEEGADDVARDAIEDVVRTAIRIGTEPEKMKGNTLSNPMEWLEKEIIASPYSDKISSAVHEAYIKFDEGSHEAKFNYIKTLARRLGTNFGFMFDPSTGQMYSQDDPRRR